MEIFLSLDQLDRNTAKSVANKVGQGINTIGGKVGDIWGKVKKVPVIGNIISSSPIGGVIDTGLGISKKQSVMLFKEILILGNLEI